LDDVIDLLTEAENLYLTLILWIGWIFDDIDVGKPLLVSTNRIDLLDLCLILSLINFGTILINGATLTVSGGAEGRNQLIGHDALPNMIVIMEECTLWILDIGYETDNISVTDLKFKNILVRGILDAGLLAESLFDRLEHVVGVFAHMFI